VNIQHPTPNAQHPITPQGARGAIQAKELLAAAAAAEAAAVAQSPEEQAAAVARVLAHQEAIQIGLMNAQIRRVSERFQTEALPLREGGDDFGQLTARIPRDLFFHFAQQRNMGWDGLYTDEGLRDVLKAFPQCRVKTVSGKTMVGSSGARSASRPTKVVFGRGTLNLAD
jgi:hypothetical protein